MNIYKLILYCGILILLVSNTLSEDSKMLLFYAYLALIYFECRDNNIRSLIIILVALDFVFFEIDYLVYVYCKYYLDTGVIAGDMILNIFIIINLMSLIISIFYRCEIMNLFNKFFKRQPFDYLPTRADVLQIYIIRIIMVVHITFFLTSAELVYSLNNATPSLAVKINDELQEQGNLYVSVAQQMEFLRHFAIVLVLSPWSKKELKSANDESTIT